MTNNTIKNAELLFGYTDYIEQYHKAIFKLMDKSNINDYICPLINLIYQTIENELKEIIISLSNDKESISKELFATHDLNMLVNNFIIIKNISISDYNVFKDEVLFFNNIIGDNSFMISRYPIDKNINRNIICNINADELYTHWSNYSNIYYKVFLHNIKVLNNNWNNK